MEAAKKNVPEKLADSFVLGNPHEDIFPAIYGATEVGNVAALGILETYTASSIIVAADVAAKTAIVKLIEVRIAKGMSGKSYMFITGEIAAVEAAIEKAKDHIAGEGTYLDSEVIARPDESIWNSIL